MKAEFTGAFDGLRMDLSSKKQELSLTVDQDAREVFENLKDCKVDIIIKKHREKRSLDANAYYWTLLGKLAKAIQAPRPYVHNKILRGYGQLEYIDGRTVEFILRDEIDVDEWESLHLLKTSKAKVLDNGELYRVYLVLRGSHTYNTEEMSALISGLIAECRFVKIPEYEIMTPNEKEELKQKWGIDVEPKNKSIAV